MNETSQTLLRVWQSQSQSSCWMLMFCCISLSFSRSVSRAPCFHRSPEIAHVPSTTSLNNTNYPSTPGSARSRSLRSPDNASRRYGAVTPGAQSSSPRMLSPNYLCCPPPHGPSSPPCPWGLPQGAPARDLDPSMCSAIEAPEVDVEAVVASSGVDRLHGQQMLGHAPHCHRGDD